MITDDRLKSDFIEFITFLECNLKQNQDQNCYQQIKDKSDHYLKKKLDYRMKPFFEELIFMIVIYIKSGISDQAFYFYLKSQFKLRDSKEQVEFTNKIKMIFGISDKKSNNDLIFCISNNCPKVSIIITTYNRKEYLIQSIKSILNQDYPNIQIIVIDDNSSDGTELVMSDLMKTNKSLIYMRNISNLGPGNNRRIAFKSHADGKYTLFLDDDDYLIDSNYISKAVEFHVKHPQVSFVAANVLTEYTETGLFKSLLLGLKEITNKHDYFINFEEAKFPKPVSTLTALFKRDALIKMDILNMEMVNDSSIYLRSLLVGDAGFIDEIIGVYRIHGSNITFNLSPDFLIANLDEKRKIKNMAINQFQYDSIEMDKWFNNNSYNTISYFFYNSAKTSNDFNYMYEWVLKNCPDIYARLKRKFKFHLYIKKISSVTIARHMIIYLKKIIKS
ncbi:hypothetical protein GCM10010912_00060 [Paenibacillus albidus]|uniref:Glycosyltransferase 2-like domain-containing protein n=1 Tax=Paenibacillus albidus TaxID=2041023 RepID=A0A917BU77_9BACL|nr:glycosyltransferase family 2 protein [Paenibacillus albidus]GGF58860.1 hypothetical protein GCM10010912_00060 [Paenibacillus albidus]